jgi:hypothetical protein
MKKVQLSWFCSIDHAVKHGLKIASEKRAKKERAETRKAKESIKTKGQYVREAQAAVNKYIRARDFNKPCISCGNLPEQKLGGTMDAGHYRSRGAAGHLRFNLLNIHAQCVKCNRYGSGNVIDYRLSLINKIGLDNVEKLESDQTIKVFTIEYLQRVKKIFNRRARFYLKKRC